MTEISTLNDIGGNFTNAWVGNGALSATPASGSGFSLNVATGQNAAGVIQTAGDLPDANWTVTNADNYKNAPIAYTVAPGNADWFGGWFANGPGSSWIAADPDTSANGDMTFTLSFNLTGYNPADATLSGGQFAIDDVGYVYLNGHLLGSSGYPGWETFHALGNGAGDFVAGVNTLVIQGVNSDSVYEAARLEGTIVDTVSTNPPGPVHWVSPMDGDFTTAADWSGGFVPGAANDAVLDAAGITLYTVTSSASETVNSIQTAATATLAITGGTFTASNGTGAGANSGAISVSNGGTLAIGGVFDNSGTTSVTAQFNLPITLLSIEPQGVTLTGGGQVTVTDGQGLTRIVGGALTNVDNTISVASLVSVAELNNEHAGVIDATGADYTSLSSNTTITNSGLIENSGPNSLGIDCSILDQTGGGTIFAGDGASIYFGFQGTLIGGTLKTEGSGFISSLNETFDGTTSPISNQGSVTVRGFDYLALEGGIDNTGTISLNGRTGPGFNARAQLTVNPGGVTLSGGGSVVLNSTGLNIVTGASSSAVLTNLDNTISGAGLLGRGSLDLINDAPGVIDATDANALTLETGPSTVTNAGLIEATGAGGLTIRNTTISNAGGVILAGDGSHVALQGGDLIGGALETTGNGSIKTYRGGPNLLDGTTLAVNDEAKVVIQNETALTIQGAIVNSNRLDVVGGSVGATLTIGAAGATLSGGGNVLMNNNAKNLVTGASPAATLTNVDNVITGAGDLGDGSLTLINETKGVIAGSQATALIIDTGANTIVNAGVILARGKGGATIQSAVSSSGLLEADGGTLTVDGAVTGAGSGMIYSGTLDFTSSFTQNVVFQKTTGVLELGQSQNYTGTITGFSKTGGTSLDLGDIAFVSSTEATFSGTASGGVLTVTDGTHTASINLRGNYLASTFIASSNGDGGTIVVDPTAAASSVPAHRFIAAAASLGGGGGSVALGHYAMSVHAPMLSRPRVMMA